MEHIVNKIVKNFIIKDISNVISISEPVIYRHFDSKIAILIAILDNYKEMAGMMSALFTNSYTIAMDKIELLFSKMIELFTEQPAMISVIFSEEIFKSDRVLKNKIIEIHNLHQSNIESIIEKGQAENNVRNDIDKSTLALMFMGSSRLLVKRWDLNSHNFNL